jgi:hypothetical protein
MNWYIKGDPNPHSVRTQGLRPEEDPDARQQNKKANPAMLNVASRPPAPGLYYPEALEGAVAQQMSQQNSEE